jgi:hypothetical protein
MGGGTGGVPQSVVLNSVLLKVQTSNGENSQNPNTGKRIRLWGYSLQITFDATCAADIGVYSVLRVRRDSNINAGVLSGYSIAGMARTVVISAVLPAPIIGDVDEPLVLKGFVWTAGSAVTIATGFYDEV